MSVTGHTDAPPLFQTKVKPTPRLPGGWSFADPSQAKHYNSKPNQEINTVHCTVSVSSRVQPLLPVWVGSKVRSGPSAGETVKLSRIAKHLLPGRPGLPAALDPHWKWFLRNSGPGGGVQKRDRRPGRMLAKQTVSKSHRLT